MNITNIITIGCLIYSVKKYIYLKNPLTGEASLNENMSLDVPGEGKVKITSRVSKNQKIFIISGDISKKLYKNPSYITIYYLDENPKNFQLDPTKFGANFFLMSIIILSLLLLPLLFITIKNIIRNVPTEEDDDYNDVDWIDNVKLMEDLSKEGEM